MVKFKSVSLEDLEKIASDPVQRSVFQKRGKEAEELRMEFVRRWPLDKLNELTLDEYSLGTGKDSFCYWVEEKTAGLMQIGGNYSTMYYIWSKPDLFSRGLFKVNDGKHTRTVQRPEAEKLFLDAKECILEVLNFAKNGSLEIKEIDNARPLRHPFKIKLVALYFPDRILHINRIECIEHVCDIFRTRFDPDYPIFSNHYLRVHLAEHEAFRNMNIYEISDLLWDSIFS
jgi:5-methylcytosine-specific restriction protein B